MKIKSLLIIAVGAFAAWYFFLRKPKTTAATNAINTGTNTDPNTGTNTGTNTNPNTGTTTNPNTGIYVGTDPGTAGTVRKPVEMRINGAFYSPGTAKLDILEGMDVHSLSIKITDQYNDATVIYNNKLSYPFPPSINITIPDNIKALRVQYTTNFLSGGEQTRGLLISAAQEVLNVPVTQTPASTGQRLYSSAPNTFTLEWGTNVQKCVVDIADQNGNKFYSKEQFSTALSFEVFIPNNTETILMNVKTIFSNGNAIKTYKSTCQAAYIPYQPPPTDPNTGSNKPVTVVEPGDKVTPGTVTPGTVDPITVVTPTDPTNLTVLPKNTIVPVLFYDLYANTLVAGQNHTFYMKVADSVTRLSVYATNDKGTVISEKVLTAPIIPSYQITVPAASTKITVATTASYTNGSVDTQRFEFSVIPATGAGYVATRVFHPDPALLVRNSTQKFIIDAHNSVKKIEITFRDQLQRIVKTLTSEAINNPVDNNVFVPIPESVTALKCTVITTYKDGVANVRDFSFTVK